ncbi:hypothetical protein ACFWY5_57740 [Nonomuraea sp. NPDC059007]
MTATDRELAREQGKPLLRRVGPGLRWMVGVVMAVPGRGPQ